MRIPSFGLIAQTQDKVELLSTLFLTLVFWACTTSANTNCGSKLYIEGEAGVLTLEEKLELLDEQFIVSLSQSVCEDPATGADVSGASSNGGSKQENRTGAAGQNRIGEGETSVALDENLVATARLPAAGLSSEQQLVNGKQEEELSIADNNEELRRQIQDLISNEESPEIRRQLEAKLKELE